MRLIVSAEQWPCAGDVRPFGKPLPPPLIVFRDGVKLRQIKGYESTRHDTTPIHGREICVLRIAKAKGDAVLEPSPWPWRAALSISAKNSVTHVDRVVKIADRRLAIFHRRSLSPEP